MRLTQQLKWAAALVLCGVAGGAAIGCAGEAKISGRIRATPPPLPDADGDGIPDPVDKCPTAEEDGLPPNPRDGCPNLDADGDGIPIPQDKWPGGKKVNCDIMVKHEQGPAALKTAVEKAGDKATICLGSGMYDFSTCQPDS